MTGTREIPGQALEILVVLALLATSAASAQAPEPNERVVRAEAPVVAGNAISAKKRALADAFRQATERALAEIVKQGEPLPSPPPPGVAQLKASLANSAQRFVRSYRLIEQQTEGGVLRVMVEADVDTVLLRQALDRARGSAPVAAPAVASAPVANFLLVAGTAAPATSIAAAALSAAGANVRIDASSSEAQLLALAAKHNAYALFVVATSLDEGMVRGAMRASVKCALRSRLFPAGAQAARGPAIDRTYEDRGFAADANLARTACLEKVSGQAARGMVSALRAPSVSAQFVTLQLDIADPGAVTNVLQTLKRMSAVTATEVRHVTTSLAEIRVFTRTGGVALGQILLRELAGKLTVAPTQTTNDLLALRVRPLDSSALEENR